MKAGKPSATLSRFLTRHEAAAMLRVSIRTLSRLDRAGDGPPLYRISPGRVVYGTDELLGWAESRRDGGFSR